MTTQRFRVFRRATQKRRFPFFGLFGLTITVLGLSCSPASAVKGDVTTLDPEFALPFGLAFDKSGSLFVSDLTARKIFKIGPNGQSVLFAGTGERGSQDGSAKIATFESPLGLVVDNKGNILVLDEGNRSIRKISPSGVVSTLAGQVDPAVRHADGQGPAARFGGLHEIAVNKNGDIFVSDDNSIRKVTPAGLVSTLPLGGLLGSVQGLVFDSSDNLYISDTSNHRIIKVAVNGVPVVFAGEKGSASFAEGKGSSARFDTPGGLAVDSLGNILVADVGNNRIRKIAKDGTTTTIAGSGNRSSSNANGLNATFTSPGNIAVDSFDNVYVSEGAYGKYLRKIEDKSSFSSIIASPVVKTPLLAQVGNSLGTVVVSTTTSTSTSTSTTVVPATLPPPTTQTTQATIAPAAPTAAPAATAAPTAAPLPTIAVLAPVPPQPASAKPAKKPTKKATKKIAKRSSKKPLKKTAKKPSKK
jgi:sugar lactone lactonase YvrE